MRNIIYALIIIFSVGCSAKKYIIVPNITGKIYSKTDKKPIKNVKFFVSKYAINNLVDTVRTDANGYFFYDGVFITDYSALRSYSTSVQKVLFLKKGNVYKYLDAQKTYNREDYNKLDTIDLGIIYFEDLKSIAKDSIPE